MRTLAQSLQHELQDSGLTQAAASVRAGVSPATVSEMLSQDHIPIP